MSDRVVDRLYRLLRDDEVDVHDFNFIGGEPTLHPEMGEVIQTLSSAASRHIELIRVVTNGSFIYKSDKKIERMWHPVFEAIQDYKRPNGLLTIRISNDYYHEEFWKRHDQVEIAKTVLFNMACLFGLEVYFDTYRCSYRTLEPVGRARKIRHSINNYAMCSHWVERLENEEKENYLEFPIWSDALIHPSGVVSPCCNGQSVVGSIFDYDINDRLATAQRNIARRGNKSALACLKCANICKKEAENVVARAIG